MRSYVKLVWASAALVLSAAAPAQGLFPGEAGAQFTSEQAARGQGAYARACLNCHGAALEGNQFGPPLKGETFAGHWRGRTRASLSEKIRTTMPPGAIGSVSSDAYGDIEAYLLQVNGASASASGGSATPPAAGAASQPAPRAEGEAASMMGPMQRRDDDPFYLAAMKSRKHKLAALTPVTDAMLKNPSPSDWAIWRRTYDAQSYSPLRQINRSNVQRLRTVWSWVLPQSMNEITPLVHDGVMFIYSGPAVHALDAASGDLMWLYQRAVRRGFGF